MRLPDEAEKPYRKARVWVFLGPPRLAAKTPVYEGWKTLDFLGFSRPKSRLINGLHGIFRGNYFVGPVWAQEAGRGSFEAIGKGGIVHGASLVQFPIISNQLSHPVARQSTSG